MAFPPPVYIMTLFMFVSKLPFTVFCLGSKKFQECKQDLKVFCRRITEEKVSTGPESF